MALHFLTERTKELFYEEKKDLYRVLTIDRLIEILEKNKWAFVSPTLWNDPYEKAFLEAEYNHNGKKFFLPIKPQINGTGFNYSLFSMCWTEIRESEAFWKTYTPNGDGVRIAVRAKDLLSMLSRIRDYDVYLGQASYEDFKTLYSFKHDEKIWRLLKSKKINQKHLELMLKKRKPFAYEKEVRILIVRKETMTKSIAKVSIANSKDIIHSYRFDPRMGSYHLRILRGVLASRYQLSDDILRQSRLYRKPSGSITFNEQLDL